MLDIHNLSKPKSFNYYRADFYYHTEVRVLGSDDSRELSCLGLSILLKLFMQQLGVI